jgi:hypothetical protein
MNTNKITIAAIITFIVTTASFAEVSKPSKERHNPEAIVAMMIGEHDQDRDGALNNAELAKSIEDLYAKRNQAIRKHRESMVAEGLIATDKADNGFVTLSPMPEDAAAFLLNGHDANANQILEANELLASTRDLRQLNLGFRPGFARES